MRGFRAHPPPPSRPQCSKIVHSAVRLCTVVCLSQSKFCFGSIKTPKLTVSDSAKTSFVSSFGCFEAKLFSQDTLAIIVKPLNILTIHICLLILQYFSLLSYLYLATNPSILDSPLTIPVAIIVKLLNILTICIWLLILQYLNHF